VPCVRIESSWHRLQGSAGFLQLSAAAIEILRYVEEARLKKGKIFIQLISTLFWELKRGFADP
jgi:hypothetical protein